MHNVKETGYSHFTWVDITSPNKDQLIELANENHLNYLQIYDSLEHGHLPKFEKMAEYNFMILRAYTGKKNERKSTVSELSNKIAFFYKEDKLITVHKASFDFLNQIDGDYKSVYHLLIKIFGEMIDTFVEPSEWHSEKIDQIEKVLFLKDYAKVSLEEMYFQKSQTRIIKKLMQITFDVINKIVPDKGTAADLEDVKDKIARLILIYDEAVEDANNLMSTYLGLTAGKSNDVMKLLTVFSAFFLPLTFIVGVYGMNFKYMPELQWQYGYLYVVILMAVISLAIWYWFKRRKII